MRAVPAAAARPRRPAPPLLLGIMVLAASAVPPQAGLAATAGAASRSDEAGGDARAQFARASAAVKAGRYDEAVEAYARAEALATGPASRANAANGAGFVFLKLRRYAEAIPHFSRAVAEDARHKAAWNNLGVCHLRRFEAGLSGTEALGSALTAFDTVAGLDPAFHPEHRKAARELLGREAACAGLAASAVPPQAGLAASAVPPQAGLAASAVPPSGTLAGAQAAPPAPPPPPAPTGTFLSYRAAGDLAEAACAWETARANYERAEAVATTKRNRCAAANLLGLLALRTRDPQAAVDAFRRASVTDPGSKYAWNNLGVALLRLYDGGTGGKELVEQSLDAFQRVAAIDAAYKPENLAWSLSVLTELGGPTVSATATQASGTTPPETTLPAGGTTAPVSPPGAPRPAQAGSGR